MNFGSLKQTLIVLAAVTTASIAQAQQAQNQDGVLVPPPEVSSIISIDAHNTILVETQNLDNPNEPKQYSLAVPKHTYSGGVARVFGGTIIPTETLVIPQSAMRSNTGAPGNFGTFSGWGGANSNGQNFGNGQSGNSNGFNRGFSTYAPRVPVNNLNQFNQVLGYLDRPIPQAQVGIGFGDTSNVNNSNSDIGFGRR